MRSSFVPSAALAALVCIAGSAAAQIAPGSTLTFTGTADATDIGLGGVVLDFTPQVVAGTSGNTGTFASLNTRDGSGRTGSIADIRVGHGPEPIPNLLQIGGYAFTLASLPSGPFGQAACYTDQFAVGQTCTPYQSVQGTPAVNAGLSPFYVANISANADGSINSIAAFNLIGTVAGPGNTTSSFFGTIAATFTGLPYQVVLYTLEQQGLQGLTFTGWFTAGTPMGGARGNGGASLVSVAGGDATVTPEPSTLLLAAVGVLGIARVAARKRTA